MDLVEKVKNKLNPVTLKNPEYEGYLYKVP